MLQELQVVVSSVLTLFLLMGVGFFFGKKGMLSNETLSQMSRILLYVVIPTKMIDSFQVERTSALDQELLTAFLTLVGLYGLYVLLSFLLFRRQPEERRGVLRFSAVYGNVSFMGIPLIQSVLGDQALMVAAMGMAIFNLFTWSHGIALIGGKSSASVKKVVLNPAAVGFVLALALFLLQLRLPGPVASSIGYLGSLNTPLAMVIVGGQMAHTGIAAAFRMRQLYATSAIKLLLLPFLTIAVLLPFRLDPLIFTALVILAACPTAGSTSLFCQSLGKDTSIAALQITLSTLLCIVTLPMTTLLAQLLRA